MTLRPDDSAATAPAVSAHGVRVTYDERDVLADLTFAMRAGEVTCLVGPNGCGKSTLLRTLSRLLKPAAGRVHLDGEAIAKVPAKALARRLAVLPQGPTAPSGITVRELAGYGRYPHQGLLGQWSPTDEAAVAWALDVTGLTAFAERDVDTLSGGERQRAWIAMALAQETPVLLLDEPTTYLDMRYQLEVLQLVRRLNREHGLTVGLVLHDLNQAAAFSDRLVLLKDGQVVDHGAPRDVLTAENVARVFGVDVTVLPHPETGDPYCLPLDVHATPGAARDKDVAPRAPRVPATPPAAAPQGA